MKRLSLAVIGATGMVGGFFVKVLEERNFPATDLKFYASPRSAGKKILFKNKEYNILALNDDIFNEDIDIALFAAGGDISAQYAPMLAKKGVVCIDNSSKFRMDASVPLVVPEVNADEAKKHDGIIANPNCSTIQSVVALAPLQKAFGIKRVSYTTYQAVSGAGQEGANDLQRGLDGLSHQKFSHPIYNNVIPQIDIFTENGYTGEEMKMIKETRKILGVQDLPVTATCVRVPIFNAHSVSINVELVNTFDVKDVVQVLQNASGVVVMNDWAKGEYPMPITADGKDEVYIGRIRRDESIANGLNMWVVADNVRKGAATNAVQIAELLI
ncbi:MAG: aspartate-semialdehyde dehydrogenase [Defluviitaleaceae bacterium]|nr:aspartate-semialdehyde dehydrogenase [Defluviitaleaceae bacterium]